jgi:integrase
MIAEGAHELEIMKRLGHSSIQVTYDRYGHLMPDRDEALSDRLDALARRAAASAPPDAVGSVVLAGRA